MLSLSAGVPFVLNLDARRVNSSEWQFGLEVAVYLTESDRAEFDRMELRWIWNGENVDKRFPIVCLIKF